jgi:hypothetical protein
MRTSTPCHLSWRCRTVARLVQPRSDEQRAESGARRGGTGARGASPPWECGPIVLLHLQAAPPVIQGAGACHPPKGAPMNHSLQCDRCCNVRRTHQAWIYISQSLSGQQNTPVPKTSDQAVIVIKPEGSARSGASHPR